ncbi:hypothetical protein NESM_000040700 [Novymonas esmeraldas]|uniref:UDENN domain-containing protein n=1 Tax=Novymonas esmeraldas TaxID=1808958 RepID=A0AAW0F3U3_9TRYP
MPLSSSSWVDCLVSIRFDLDIGPKIESVSPPNAITEEGKTKLLHCAFPDCNPDCGYNFIFYFTMPDCTTAAAASFSQTVAPPTTANTVPELYGAAFYRQKHDPSVPRRYVQQVVVLLSHLPYYNVHELILRVVAPRFCQCCSLSPDTGKVPVSSVLSPTPEAYFEVDQSYSTEHYTQADVLRDATAELAQWPSPHPRARYAVTLLQQAIVFITPAHSQRQSSRVTRSSGAAVRRAMSLDDRVEFMETSQCNARQRGSALGNDALPLFSLLGEQLHHLTYVWELLIRHEPLFILSNTPCMASAAAFGIASLVLPIEFNGTLRSYFTVQNDDFPRLSRMGKVLAFPTHEGPVVAGTNPFLLRSFSGWPSLMVVMDRNTATMVNGSIASPAPSAEGRAPPASAGAPMHVSHTSQHHPHHQHQRHHASATPPVAGALPRVVLLEELRAMSPPPPPLSSAHGSLAHMALRQAPMSSAAHSGTSASSLASMATSAQYRRRSGQPHDAPVTMVLQNTSNVGGGGGGPGVAVSADVAGRKPLFSPTLSYATDPHATYDLESSTDSSRSTSCPSRDSAHRTAPASAAAHGRRLSEVEESVAAVVGGMALDRSTSTEHSSQSEGAARQRELRAVHDSGADAATDTSTTTAAATRPTLTPITMSSPVSSSVTLFTMDHYKTAVESVRAAEHRKRGGTHQESARGSLQQRLHNYFDSSVHFLLDHAEQTQMLLRRLEMVSLLDADAQRTSVTLSLTHLRGGSRSASSPTTGANGVSFAAASSSFTTAAASASRRFTPHHVDPAAEASDVTPCSHFSVADDMVRKFFTSLTSEFLTPVTAWFHKVTAAYTAFHLCDRALCDALLSPASFLDDLALRHRETAPAMWTQLHSYKTYKVVYERFAHGCLFRAYVRQLVDVSLRQQMEEFQVEDWVTRIPSDAERIDLLINLFNTIQRELSDTVDPDVLFVTSATSVLASMAVVLQQPHREQFMLKIGELKL